MARQDIKQIRGATQGSILFLGTNSTVSEDFNKLSWDESNDVLNVSGQLKIVDGNQQNGYVLTTDSTGLASWTSGSQSLNDLTDVDLTTDLPQSGDRLVYDGSNWVPQRGAFTSDELLDIYPSSSQTITTSGGGNPTSYVDINWGSQIIVGASFTHSTVTNTQNITILEDGWYEVSVSLSTDNSTNNRTITNIRLMLNDGGGFVQVPRTFGAIYNRTASAGEGTVTKTLKLNLSDGDILKLQSRRFTGSGGITVIEDGSNITMTKLT